MVISHPEKDIISSELSGAIHKGQTAAAEPVIAGRRAAPAPAQRAPRGKGWLRARPGRPPIKDLPTVRKWSRFQTRSNQLAGVEPAPALPTPTFTFQKSKDETSQHRSTTSSFSLLQSF